MRLQRKKILIVIMGLSFILSLNFFQKEVRGFFYSISEPIQKSLWKAGNGVSDFFEGIFKAGNLKKENKELNLKIQKMFWLQNSINELEEENRTIRDALGVGLQKDFRLELAEIISKDINQDAVLIDKGLKNGIEKGMFVITSEKVLVGKIADVYQNYSKVSLISNQESQLEVRISGSKVSGLLKGAGFSRVLLDLIPMEDKIEAGDLVVSGNFLVGLIKEVKRIDVSPFQRAEISPFFKISDLDKVFVVLN